jgi:uncharacterized protein involved in exopolysaccharide biosynthesis
VPSPEERLEILKTQLITASATYSDRHPDVVRLKKEIQELRKEVSLKQDLGEKHKQLAALNTDLDILRGRYKPRHPDIIATQRKISTLEADIVALARKNNPGPTVHVKPDNPAYINLATQIESVALQIEARKKEREELKKSLAEYQRRLENTPQVEKTYLLLTRDRENTWARYQETLKKLMEARVAEGMEQEQKGERFTIIDPAQYPEKPFKPNRLAIVLITLILGIGAGVGFASVTEFMDRSVKTADDLFSATGIPVLVSVPYITTEKEVRRRRIKQFVVLACVLAAIAAGIVAFHLYVMNLEVFWARATRFLAKRFTF